jgi:hypothetical protein
VTEPKTPRVGVWRAVGRLGSYTVRELLWPEGFFGLTVGVGGAVLLVRGSTMAERVGAMDNVLAIAGALLAVVFTALALVVSIPSMDYIRKLAETKDGGMLRFLDPFLVAVGTQAVVIIGALGYSLAAANVSPTVEHAAFYVLGFLFVFGLLDVVALARSLVRHGINRGKEALASPTATQSTGDVRHLDERRGGQG